MEKQAGFKLHIIIKQLQVCSVFHLAKNTNSTLKGFFYHLSSIIYTSLFFAVTFEKLTKIFQSLKMIHRSYSRSYFNLLLIYSVAWMHVNTNLHKYKNSCDSSKDKLVTKILSRFSKLPDKNLSLVLFLSPKNLTSLKLYTQVLLVGAFAIVRMVAAMFLEK